MCAIRQNPYIIDHPIKDELSFHGGERLLQDIQQFVYASHENVRLVYGLQRSGKTSLLFQLERVWKLEGVRHVVYFDFHPRSELSTGQVLYAIACALSEFVQRPLPEKSYFDNDEQFFSAEFLPQLLEVEQACVLLFDGCDVLDSLDNTAPLHPLLRHIYEWTQRCKAIKFVFAFKQHPENLSYFSSMFKSGDPIQIPCLAHEETEQLIRISELNPVSLFWMPEAVERVWQWTQGHPYFTQVLCSEIWHQMGCHTMNGPAPATAQDVDRGVAKVLKSRTDTFETMWEDARPVEKIMLATVAQGSGEGHDSAVDMQELSESLERYRKAGLLREMDGEYDFSVPLLRRWVADHALLFDLKNEFIESLTSRVISTVFHAKQPIVAIWGDIPFFQDMVRELPQNIVKHEQGLYLDINMKEVRQDTEEGTLFKLIELLGDAILQRVPDTEMAGPLYKALYRLQQMSKKSGQADFHEMLRGLVEFSENEMYPAFRVALQGYSQLTIGLEHFEDVAGWGVSIRRFVLEVLSKNTIVPKVKWLLLARTSKELRLHYGSDRENSLENMLFHELNADR